MVPVMVMVTVTVTVMVAVAVTVTVTVTASKEVLDFSMRERYKIRKITNHTIDSPSYDMPGSIHLSS